MTNPLCAVAYMLGAGTVYVTGQAAVVVLHLAAPAAGITARLVVAGAVFIAASAVVGGLAVPRLEQWAAQQQDAEQASERAGDDR